MYKRIFLTIALCLSLNGLGIAAARPEIVLKETVAKAIDRKAYQAQISELGVFKEGLGEIFYHKDYPNLMASQRMNDDDTYTLTIDWNGKKKNIVEKGSGAFIGWRPRHCAFLYIHDVESDSDYGLCSLHYVTVEMVNGQLKLKNTEVTKEQTNSDFAWSNDGRFYVYSVQTSIEIREFDTGQIWSVKSLRIKANPKDIVVKDSDYPKDIGGFYVEITAYDKIEQKAILNNG